MAHGKKLVAQLRIEIILFILLAFMEIYLVRHTTPDIARGICYGQADIGVKETFYQEAAIIQQHLPVQPAIVYSSPLQRCIRLAEHLFADHRVQQHPDLMEINCGHWELQPWDDIPRDEIANWMEDHINVRIPGGESYTDVFERVAACFNRLLQQHKVPPQLATETNSPVAQGQQAVIFAHGGVIRSILSHITKTPLKDSFSLFSLYYGCVIKIVQRNDQLLHEVLSNIAHEKETHKPSYL